MTRAGPLDRGRSVRHRRFHSIARRGRPAAVGHAHGPDRHHAHLWCRSALLATGVAAQPLCGILCRSWRYGNPPEQHRDRASGCFLCRPRAGRNGAGARGHAGRRSGQHAGRSGAVVQYPLAGAGPDPARRGDPPGCAGLDFARSWSRRNRPRSDAPGAAPDPHGLGADAQLDDPRGTVRRSRSRDADRNPDRRAAHLARPLQPGGRAPDHVARQLRGPAADDRLHFGARRQSRRWHAGNHRDLRRPSRGAPGRRRQPPVPVGRLRCRGATGRHDRALAAAAGGRSRPRRGQLSHRLQFGPRPRLHPVDRRRGQALRESSCPTRRSRSIPSGRAISIARPWTARAWHSPARRARRCAWAT